MRAAVLAAILAALPAFPEDRGTCEHVFEASFHQNAQLRLDLRSGDIDIAGSDEEVVRVECELKEPQRAREVSIRFVEDDGSGRLRIHGGPNGDVRLRIQVPKESNLIVRSTAGDLDLRGVRGNKDVSLRAGDLTIDVGDPEEYSSAEASVTAGDIQASAFGVHKGGLFRSFKQENSAGRYRLKARLWAGDIKLR